VLASSVATSAQTTQQAIEARLKGKPLYLRGQWAPNALQFDLGGVTASPSISAPFTLCGIDIDKVHLTDKQLEITGDRVGLEFEKDTPQRASLHTPIKIKISGSVGSDYGPALDKIFADDLSALASSMPFYWQNYAQAHFLPASSPAATPTPVPAPLPLAANTSASTRQKITPNQKPVVDEAGEPLRKIGGHVMAPVAIHMENATFSNEARDAKFSGLVTVQLIVNTRGLPESVHVIRGVGMGLDEKAVEAVRQYRFRPAMEDGKPVPVLLNVEVNFQFLPTLKKTKVPLTAEANQVLQVSRNVIGEIHPPQLLAKADPVFPDAVKNLQYSARSTVGIRIKEDGSVVDPFIVQPAGLGLDEEALRAVAQYRFKPATREDGTPVSVQLNIEVNFQIGR